MDVTMERHMQMERDDMHVEKRMQIMETDKWVNAQSWRRGC